MQIDNGKRFACEGDCGDKAIIKSFKWNKPNDEHQFQCSHCERYYALTTGGRIVRIYKGGK